MNFLKNKKNTKHSQNFNKQYFANWEFLDQTRVVNSDKENTSSQFLVSFIIILSLYSFMKTGYLFTIDIGLFNYDIWAEVSSMFSSWIVQENDMCVDIPHTLPKNTPDEFNNALSKMKVFYLVGIL